MNERIVILKYATGTALLNISNMYRVERTNTTQITFYPNGSASFFLNFSSAEDTVSALKAIDHRLGDAPFTPPIP